MKLTSMRLVRLTILAVVLSWCLEAAPAWSQQADLSVTKTVSAPSAVEGAELTYTITLFNFGPDAATNARVSDPMQPGNTFHAAGISQGSYTFDTALRTFSANFGVLLPGASATAVLEVVPRVILEGVLYVTGPASVAGDFPAGLATFGPALTLEGFPGLVAAAEPALACGPLTNPASVAGKIALIDRGTCTFVVKVKNAQNAGAIGVIIANSEDSVSGMGGLDPTITIPSLMVALPVGNSIKTALAEGVSASLATRLLSTQQRVNGVTATADEQDLLVANNSAIATSTILRDTDGDLTPDNADPCPGDPLKLDPGFCGCGTQDVDADGTGAIDCLNTNELAGRVNAATVLVGQLKFVNGRIRNRAAMKAQINAQLLETSAYLAAHTAQINLAGATVNPGRLLRDATVRTKAVFRSNAATFKTAKSAALRALRKLRAGLLPV